MSDKADATAELLRATFVKGDRVIDWEGDTATVLECRVLPGGWEAVTVQYDRSDRYPHPVAGMPSDSFKLLP